MKKQCPIREVKNPLPCVSGRWQDDDKSTQGQATEVFCNETISLYWSLSQVILSRFQPSHKKRRKCTPPQKRQIKTQYSSIQYVQQNKRENEIACIWFVTWLNSCKSWTEDMFFALHYQHYYNKTSSITILWSNTPQNYHDLLQCSFKGWLQITLNMVEILLKVNVERMFDIYYIQTNW